MVSGEAALEAQCETPGGSWEGRGALVKLIDPDGYLFDVTRGWNPADPGLNAISGVTVTCMVSLPQWGGWVPWPAHAYGQANPQVTDATYPDGATTTGYFAFFTPPGLYYLQVDGVGASAVAAPLLPILAQPGGRGNQRRDPRQRAADARRGR